MSRSLTFTHDRRRTPRVEIAGRIRSRIVSLQASLKVLDLSLDGFAVETPVELSAGTVHRFRFDLEDEEPLILHAEVAYCRDETPQGGSSRYVSGLRFLDHPERVDRLLDSVVSVLSFESRAMDECRL